MPNDRTRLNGTASAALKSIGIGILTALSVTACQNPQRSDLSGHDATDKGSGAEQTFVFECDDGFRFTARTAENTVWLFLPGHAVQLPRIRSGSGSTYASAEITFRHQPEVASLETETRSHRSCVNNRARAVCDHAKLEGVDLRATGIEPGWHMDITLGDEIVLITDYGQSAYRFKTPAPNIDQTERKTTYTARDGQRRLVVELEGQPCRDSMSDQSFEITVAVTLDERRFHGCGKALH